MTGNRTRVPYRGGAVRRARGALSAKNALAYSDPAAGLERILRELYDLESRAREAAEMLERPARELPEMADLLHAGIRAPVLAASTRYLDGRAAAVQA